MSTQPTDLASWLLDRIAADERVARATGNPGPWTNDDGDVYAGHPVELIVEWSADAEHIARHDPARVLAECQAKRAIVGEHVPGVDRCDWHDCVTMKTIPCPTLQLLALPYADCDGYRSEWAP